MSVCRTRRILCALVLMLYIFIFQINEAAFHSARLLLDIEAGSPIILIPHSSRTSDVLVADLGRMSVKNCFKFDGDSGTFTATTRNSSHDEGAQGQARSSSAHEPLSRTSSRTSQRSLGSTSGVITSRSVSQVDSAQSGFDELLLPRASADPMTDSIYGGLDIDVRSEDEIYDPTEDLSEDSVVDFQLNPSNSGSSVDPSTPGPSARRSWSDIDASSSRPKRTSLYIPKRGGSFIDQSDSSTGLTSPGLGVLSAGPNSAPPHSPSSVMENVFSSATSLTKEQTATDNRNVFADIVQLADDGDSKGSKHHRCLLDVLEVTMSDMDLFSAERVEKTAYGGKHLNQDLEFPSCVIQRQVGVFFFSSIY